VPPFAIENAAQRALGDLAVTVRFQLAPDARKAPRAIAQELADAVGDRCRASRDDRRSNGYLNLFLERPTFLIDGATGRAAGPCRGGQDRRRAHGHQSEQGGPRGSPAQRRARRHAGPRAALPRHAVETQNYIDDTGVQVADVIVGFRELEHKTLAGGEADRRTDAVRLLLLGPLLAVTEWYDGDKRRSTSRARRSRSRTRRQRHAEMGAFIVDRIVRAHLRRWRG
jgi:arginyl-tRNA synthetase